MNDISGTVGNSDNAEIIKNLQERLSQLEKQLSIQGSSSEKEEIPSLDIPKKDDDELEFRISEFWLPKLGIFVFIVGVIFCLTLPFEGIHATIPSICGYALALAIMFLGFHTKKSFEQLSGYFIGGSAAIAYLSTLRLYFFGTETVLGSWVVELLGLLFVVSTTLWYAVKNKSVYLAALGIFLGYFNALTIESFYLFFIAIFASSSFSVYLFLKNKWQSLLVFAIVLAYLTHFVWFVGNPFFQNTFELLKNEVNLFFILGYVSIFGFGILKRRENSSEEFLDIVSSLLNSAAGYGLFLIITLLNTSPYFGTLHLIAAVVFLTFAILFWVREKSLYSTFIYAMTGYAALSVAIIFQFDKPMNMILLCWQSLLVLSTAVWFKSRFIIVTNFIIFMLVLIAYLVSYWTLQVEAISFGLTALISARILNWQKDRLELKTEQMRNAYLIIALFWIPYVFYCVFPSVYVGLSLLLLSLAYFSMSKILKNLKYRWMAVMTLLITVFYLMVFGITNPDTTYKIISFLAAGIVLILTSAAYSRIKAKTIKKV
ncbi:MAG: DUF2339 domain-containing protein [Ignavibacteriales bacterium]|nr:MAG: DUF2339 domain-containing protein [Ignavibacteriales bacterium]